MKIFINSEQSKLGAFKKAHNILYGLFQLNIKKLLNCALNKLLYCSESYSKVY